MDALYIVGLAMACVTGCVGGWLVTQARFERIASAEREYERELAEAEELYVAQAILRRMPLYNQMGDNETID
jgi:iron only hydrogenase large subunit-like protein